MKKYKKHIIIGVVFLIVVAIYVIVINNKNTDNILSPKTDDGGDGSNFINPDDRNNHSATFPLQFGIKGKEVKALQKYLNFKDNVNLTVDGDWGDKTQSQVLKHCFQEYIGISMCANMITRNMYDLKMIYAYEPI